MTDILSIEVTSDCAIRCFASAVPPKAPEPARRRHGACGTGSPPLGARPPAVATAAAAASPHLGAIARLSVEADTIEAEFPNDGAMRALTDSLRKRAGFMLALAHTLNCWPALRQAALLQEQANVCPSCDGRTCGLADGPAARCPARVRHYC